MGMEATASGDVVGGDTGVAAEEGTRVLLPPKSAPTMGVSGEPKSLNFENVGAVYDRPNQVRNRHRRRIERELRPRHLPGRSHRIVKV